MMWDLLFNIQYVIITTILSSYNDEAHRKNKFFHNRNILQIKLYVNDFTIVCPIGNKSKHNKLCGMDFSLDNIPPKYRSRMYTVQLLQLVKSIDLKKFTLHVVMQKIIMDLMIGKWRHQNSCWKFCWSVSWHCHCCYCW